MTGKEIAKEIRRGIKELGYNRSQFSVRNELGGYSTCIRIESKNNEHTSKDFKAINNLTKKYTSVDICETTGEILSGGNTYIIISNSYGTIQ